MSDSYIIQNAINIITKSYKNISANGVVGNGSDVIISDAGTNYTIQTLVAGKVKISAANAADTSAGAGARTVRLYGLDGDYNPLEEDIILNGQTAVETVNNFIFVEKLIVLTSGTAGATNTGIIYAGTGDVTSGVPATKWLMILAGVGTSRAGFMCVPAGYYAVIEYVNFSDDTATHDCNFKWWTRTAVNSKIQQGMKRVAALSEKDISTHYILPEKTIIWATGNSSSGTPTVSVIANYRLIPN